MVVTLDLFKEQKKPKNYGAKQLSADFCAVHFYGKKPRHQMVNSNGQVEENQWIEPLGYEPRYDYVFNNHILIRHPNENKAFRQWRLATVPSVQSEIFKKSFGEIKAIGAQKPNFTYSVEDDLSKVLEDLKFNDLIEEDALTAVYTDSNSVFIVIPQYVDVTQPPVLSIEHIPYSDILVEDVTDELVCRYKNFVLVSNKDSVTIWGAREKEVYIVSEYTHFLGKPLHKVVGGIYDKLKNAYQSDFAGFVEWANLLIRNISDDEAMMKLYGYPRMVEYTEVCPDCHGEGMKTQCLRDGEEPENVACGTCRGQKTVVRNLGEAYQVPFKDKNDPTPYPSKVVEFITPDVGILAQSSNRVKDLLQKCYDSLYLSKSEDKASGISKDIDRDAKGIFVKSILDRVYDISHYMLSCILSLNNFTVRGHEWIESNMQKPTVFKLVTIDSMLEEVKAQKEKKAEPAVLKETSQRYLEVMYSDNPYILRKNNVLTYIDRLKHYDDNDIRNKRLTNSVSDKDIFIHEFAWYILDKLIYTNGQNWFMQVSEVELINRLQSELDKLFNAQPSPVTLLSESA